MRRCKQCKKILVRAVWKSGQKEPFCHMNSRTFCNRSCLGKWTSYRYYGDPKTRKEKFCYHCKQFLPKNQFYKNKSKRDGLTHECIKCKNIIDRKSSTGWTQERFKEYYEKQQGKCAICFKFFSSQKGTHTGPHADHNHSTNTPRELLCNKCNLLMGYVHDDIKILQRVITYLKKYETKMANT